MVVSIILLYAIGIIFLILALETEKPQKDEVFKDNGNQSINDLIYAGLSIFFNLVGYFASYSQTDYVSYAYIPLAVAIVSTLLLIYRIYGYLPKGNDPWGEETEDEEWNNRSKDEKALRS